MVIRLAELWRLIAKADELSPGIVRVPVDKKTGKVKAPVQRFSGCIEIIRDSDGVRHLRMKGIKEPSSGWWHPTVIASATLDAELMKTVWVPKAKYSDVSGKWDFNELPKGIVARPKHVVVRQTIDASFSKTWTLDPENMPSGTCDILAMVLREAVQLAPLHSLMICHLATELMIAPEDDKAPRPFHVPPWLELAHHGAVTGLNKWSTVRAQFVIGRAMPSAELITLQAEAMTGEYISQRNYIQREVPIFIEPDADGRTSIDVKQYEHPHPLAQRLLRRVHQPKYQGLV